MTTTWTRKDVKDKHIFAFKTPEKIAKFRRPIIQIDFKFFQEISRYESIREAVRKQIYQNQLCNLIWPVILEWPVDIFGIM
jgi:hypothetical protein